jgi:hypothetical protein
MTATSVRLYRRNLQAGRRLGLEISSRCAAQLRQLTHDLCLSLAAGEILLLGGNWYVTHSGLLHIAQRRRCAGIHVEIIRELSDPSSLRWVAKATVYRSPDCKGFTGYGDADPSNVSQLVRGAELRVAETRATNRGLRKAYGIGLCSVEEIGSAPEPPQPVTQRKSVASEKPSNNGNGQSLRDRLRLIVRQHQLDPAAVKAYAADFCEVKELREATRQQMEYFVHHLSELVEHDRAGLLCVLNSYHGKAAASGPEAAA